MSEELEAENKRLKETVTRLNRWCQSAESAVNDCIKIKGNKMQDYAIGRRMLTYNAQTINEENKVLKARIAKLELEIKE